MGKADVFTGMSLTEKLIWLKKFGNGGGSAPTYADRTATGNPVIFTTNFAQNAKALSASFSPKQDLHGYSKPWAGGNGKNLWKFGDITTGQTVKQELLLSAGTYILSGTKSASSRFGVRFYYTDGSGNVLAFCNEGAFTLEKDTNAVTWNTVTVSNIQLERGSTKTSFEPYENICPITGISSIDVVANSITHEFNLGRTVYGGRMSATDGVLTVTDALIASYNGEVLPSTWMSDRDEYSAGTTPTIGAQVVYKLATPLAYQLTAQQIALLEGENVIATDGDDLNVTYQVKV